MSGLTRGPLSPRVYWTRRVMVLGTAVLLVFGIARALGAGSDASSEPEAEAQATQAAAVATTTLALPDNSPGATGKAGRGEGRREVVPLAMPEGPCDDEDVAVTPTVDRPVAGRDVRIVLELRTIVSEACTWEVSPGSLTLKITSGDDEIWTSRHCPRAVPHEQVTLRRAESTRVEVVWDARRSDEECSNLTPWALPGWYHVAAAALAGEPSDLQFQLERPEGEHVTKTVEPKPRSTDRKQRDRSRG
ncbi:hypothetical protein [Nocardioides sp.]|uniref:hypothetical protein n=1 Tax=Nocardioides sp. TaxID=35761 RepID=UPI002D7F74CA|nr:hypothetical protein [Nocardioides sp.]HET8961843.1 hypothetical protein [Nocardioides sp.]